MKDIDLDLLQSNLELTPEERLEAHQKALDLLWEIDRARAKLINEKSQQSFRETPQERN